MAKRIVRRESFIAFAFATGILNSPLLALCADQAASCETVIDGIASATQSSAENRAYHLLSLASVALDGKNVSEVEPKSVSYRVGSNQELFFKGERGEKWLETWAGLLAAKVNFTNETGVFRPKSKSAAKSIPAENVALANRAIKHAVFCLDKSTEQFAKLNLIFIASLLYQKAGNTEGARICKEVVDLAIKSCETEGQPEELVRAVTSILSSMAFGVVPVQIPDEEPNKSPYAVSRQPPLDQFYRTQIEESDKLRLKATVIADRLPASNHTRRMMHRNLVLWYELFGKRDLAQKQKDILFDLVGIREDRILYPKSEGCGQLAWWGTESRFPIGCGMG